MVLADVVAAAPRLEWRAWAALTKPRLSLMVLCTAGTGLYLAPGQLPWPRALGTLLATAGVVGAANGLNSYLERHSDARMRRTRGRPLPQGQLEPRLALGLSLALGLLSMAALYAFANPITALLSFAAFAIYGWVYTPMKRISWYAVLVGAVPGAIPPLMGWTAVTGDVGGGGMALFALLFFWQLPHFLAIALYLKDDYARGGLRVLPTVHGARVCAWGIAVSALVLLPASLLPAAAGLGGALYCRAAALCWLAFAGVVGRGLRGAPAGRWARQVFLSSIAHLTVLLGLLLMGSA